MVENLRTNWLLEYIIITFLFENEFGVANFVDWHQWLLFIIHVKYGGENIFGFVLLVVYYIFCNNKTIVIVRHTNKFFLTRSLKTNVKNLSDENIFIFGIKPTRPSNEYGYLKTKSINKLNKVTKFIEKPTEQKAKKIIKSGGYWNSGMFYLKKSSIINNFKKYQPSIYKACLKSLEKYPKLSSTINNIEKIDFGFFKTIFR